jgi:hypothetical protein
VANAVGAAAGLVAHRFDVHVEGDGNGVFRILGAGQAEILGSGVTALALAERKATEGALALAIANGAYEPRIMISVKKHFLPDASSDEGLLSALVSAEAIGRPHA